MAARKILTVTREAEREREQEGDIALSFVLTSAWEWPCASLLATKSVSIFATASCTR